MKVLTFLFIYSVLFSNYLVAQTFLTKSEILRQSNQCLQDFQNKICKSLILKLQTIQLMESEKNRYDCQSSLLGLQSELIEIYYFQKNRKSDRGIMIPFVIKNC